MSKTYLITNARIVNEGVVTEGDLLVRDGRIAGIDRTAPEGAEIVDAAGAWLLPGMIDDQVHFREPGLEHKGTIATESRAAIAGGITSYMEMPNCNPLTVTHEMLRDKHARAADHSMANYAFYFGATNDNLEAIKTVDPHLTCGIKVFMGASTGDMLVDNEATLEGIFAGTELIIATHCEDTPTILANEAAARERYGENIPFTEHPKIRSEEACWKSSSLAVSLAKKHNARLHVIPHLLLIEVEAWLFFLKERFADQPGEIGFPFLINSIIIKINIFRQIDLRFDHMEEAEWIAFRHLPGLIGIQDIVGGRSDLGGQVLTGPVPAKGSDDN